MADELVMIARFGTAAEAHEAQFVLDDSGIESAIADETVINLGIPGSVGLGGVKLLVKESEATKANEALKQTPAGKNLLVEGGGTDEQEAGGEQGA
jgi:hypothetical protein